MASSYEGIFVKTDPQEISFEINTAVYSVSVILKAAYYFIDKAYIYIDAPDEKKYLVHLRPKLAVTTPSQLAGEFLNQCLNQKLQEVVDKETGKIREMLVAQAFSDAHLSIAKNESEKERVSYKQDPLNIGKLRSAGDGM